MTDAGESCFPSINHLCHETGLSRSSVIKHLEKARKEGWIKIRKNHRDDGTWARNTYLPAYPDGDSASGIPGDGVSDALRVREVDSNSSSLSERDSDSGLEFLSESRINESQIHASASGATKKNTAQKKNGVDRQFDIFWAAYPEKVGKKKAREKFGGVIKHGEATIDQLLAGIEKYREDKPKDRAWCHPATWLHQGRWDDQPAPPYVPEEDINYVLGR